MAGKKCNQLTFRDFLSGVCACLNVGLVLSILMSMNVLFTDWLNSFGAGRGRTAVVQVTSTGVTYGGGLVAGMLERKLGERVSLLLGTALASAGFLAGGFVTSLPALIVCVGVVTGCGLSLLYLCTMSTTLKRFPKRAGFMSSAMLFSAGLMHLGSPLLVRYLSEQYTWRGCLVLTGGIVLHIAIFSLLLTSPLLHSSPAKPPPNSTSLGDHELVARGPCSDITDSTAARVHHSSGQGAVYIISDGNSNTESTFQTESSKAYFNPCAVVDDERGATESRIDDLNTKERENGISLPSTKSEEKNASSVVTYTGLSDTVEKRVANERNGCFARFRSIAAFVKDPLYICVALCSVVSFSTTICFVYLVLDFATQEGWSVQDGIFLNFMFQLLGLLSRALVCVVSLHKRARSIAVLLVSGMVCGVGICSVGQVSSFWLAALLYACMGIGYSGVACTPAAVLEVTGPGSTYSLALGLVVTLMGIGQTLVGILAGFLVDVFRSYSVLSFVYGPLPFLAAVLLLYVYLCRSRSQRGPDTASGAASATTSTQKGTGPSEGKESC